MGRLGFGSKLLLFRDPPGVYLMVGMGVRGFGVFDGDFKGILL